jgi:hypothetical protein
LFILCTEPPLPQKFTIRSLEKLIQAATLHARSLPDLVEWSHPNLDQIKPGPGQHSLAELWPRSGMQGLAQLRQNEHEWLGQTWHELVYRSGFLVPDLDLASTQVWARSFASWCQI